MATRGRKKGTPKTGGRKKGTPNKRTELLAEILERKNFCPAEKAIRIYKRALEEFDKDRSDFRFKYLEIAQKQVIDLMQYKFPKRKAIEFTGEDGEPLSFVELIERAAKRMG